VNVMTHPTGHWLMLLTLSATLFGVTASPSVVHAQPPSRVGLVVRLDNGQAVTRCVQFDEPAISGQDVLLRSGLEVVADGQAICDIEGQSGCSTANCFCRCQSSPCLYWSYWHLAGGDWQSSGIGAGDYQVDDGDVEGWSWGTGAPPPATTFGRICLPVGIYLPLVYRL
jgi:hypothetical protein